MKQATRFLFIIGILLLWMCIDPKTRIEKVEATKEYVGRCPGKGYLTIYGDCYYPKCSTQPLNQTQAKKLCENQFAEYSQNGFDLIQPTLASFKEMDTIHLISQTIKDTCMNNNGTWIGIEDPKETDGPYMWTDGTSWQLTTNWGVGQPQHTGTEGCGIIKAENGKFETTNCEATFYSYACKAKAQPLCENIGCECEGGYTGVYCNRTTCFGKENGDTNVCGAHGTCVYYDTCEACTGGYSQEEPLMSCRQENRKLFVTGKNGDGQLGLGHKTAVYAYLEVNPQSIFEGEIPIKIVGRHHSIALLPSGKVLLAGSNSHNQVQNGLLGGDADEFIVATGISHTAIDVSANYDATHVLLSSGDVYSCGSNFNGQFGQGFVDILLTNPNFEKFEDENLAITEKAIAIYSGYRSNVIVTNEKNLYFWGRLSFSSVNQPTLASPAGEQISVASCGHDICMMITESSKAYCFGSSTSCQTGSEIYYNSPQLTAIATSGTLSQVACTDYSCILSDESGYVYGVGFNVHALLNGWPGTRGSQIDGIIIDTVVGASVDHYMYVQNDTQFIMGVGSNAFGQMLGNGNTITYTTHQKINGGTGYLTGLYTAGNMFVNKLDTFIFTRHCYGISSMSDTVCAGHGRCIGDNQCSCLPGYFGNQCERYYCHSIEANASNVCSSNGKCLSTDVCACRASYSGSQCETRDFTRCFGILSTNSSVCSAHGTCVDPDECSCQSTYTGISCSIPLCDSIVATNASVCSTHGTCQQPDDCLCDTNYYGPTCSLVKCFDVLSNNSLVCSGHGSCITLDTCECHTNWYGNNCSIPSCYGILGNDSNTCSGHGACMNEDVCSCDDRYHSSNCSIHECFDYNSNSPQVCSGHGVCTEMDQCFCEVEYAGVNCSLYTCFQIGPYASEVCHSRGICTGQDLCECNEGYFGDACEKIGCYGHANDSISVCNNHGNCLFKDTCQCQTGYMGLNCSIPICNSKPANDSQSCSSHGSCVAADSCDCDTHYSGSTCEIYACQGILSNDSSVCSSHGECQAHDSCLCDSTFHGAQCSIFECYGKLSNQIHLACSGNGTCVSSNECACLSGHYGPECESYACFDYHFANTSVCSTHGSCVDVNSCLCDSGYHGTDCQITQCFEKLSNTTDVCSGHGLCTAPDQCDCDNDHFGPSCALVTCQNILSNESSVCSSHGSCSDTDSCLCDTSYYGVDCSLFNCNQTSSLHASVCSGHGDCLNPDACSCDFGYEGQNCEIRYCFQIRNNDTQVCSSHGSCVEYNTCICDNGYFGEHCNITTCQQLFSNTTSVCSSHGSCVAMDQCSCDNHYSNVDCSLTSCHHIASNLNSVCSSHGSCVEYNVCQCQPGYFGKHCNITMCNHQFSNDSDVCSSHGRCVSLNDCDCETHYSHDTCNVTSCFQIDSDAANVCSSHGSCVDYNSCVCQTNYFGPQCNQTTCDGIHFTNASVCHANGQCVDYNQCSCHPHYSGMFCEDTTCFGVSSKNADVCHGRGKCIGYNTCVCDNTTRVTGADCGNCTDNFDGDQCDKLIVLNAIIIAKSTMGPCGHFELDGTESSINIDETIHYKWTIEDAPSSLPPSISVLIDNSKLPLLSLPSTIPVGKYRIGLRIYTTTGRRSSLSIHEFTKVNEEMLETSIESASHIDIHPSDDLVLIGRVRNPCATNFSIYPNLTWSFNSLIFSNTTFLHIPKGSFPKIETIYNLEFQATHPIFKNSTSTIQLHVTLKDLIAQLNDTSRKIPNSKLLTLSPHLSSDPERVDVPEQYSYRCYYATLANYTTSKFENATPCWNGQQVQNYFQLMPSKSGYYRVEMDFRKGDRMSTAPPIIYSMDHTHINKIPWVRILPPTRTVYNPYNDKIALSAELIQEEMLQNASLKWSIVQPSLPLTANDTLSMSISEPNIVIPTSFFNTSLSTTYRIRLTTTVLHSLTSCYAEIDVSLNLPPKMGQVTVSPSNGTVLDTFFTFRFSSFADENIPLMYELYYIHNNQRHLLYPKTYSKIIRTQILIPGCKSQSYRVPIVAIIYDRLDAATERIIYVQVKPVSYSSAIEWVKFANNFLTEDYIGGGGPPTPYLTVYSNVFQVVHTIAGALCVNCSKNSCMDDVCLIEQIKSTIEFKTFQKRAFVALTHEMSKNTPSPFLISTSSLSSTLQDMNCLISNLFDPSINVNSIVPSVSNLTLTYQSFIKLPQLETLSSILSNALSLTFTSLEDCSENLMSPFYNSILNIKSLYLNSLIPGEHVEPVVSPLFSIRAFKAPASSYLGLTSLQQYQKNVTLMHNHMNVHPNIAALTSNKKDYITLSLISLHFDPHCDSFLEHVNGTSFVRIDTYVNDELFIQQDPHLNRSLYDLSFYLPQEEEEEGTKRLIANPMITKPSSIFCGQYAFDGYLSNQCQFTIEANRGFCQCNTINNSVISLFYSSSNTEIIPPSPPPTEPVVPTNTPWTLYISLMASGLLLLTCSFIVVLVCINGFVCFKCYKSKQNGSKTQAVYSINDLPKIKTPSFIDSSVGPSIPSDDQPAASTMSSLTNTRSVIFSNKMFFSDNFDDVKTIDIGCDTLASLNRVDSTSSLNDIQIDNLPQSPLQVNTNLEVLHVDDDESLSENTRSDVKTCSLLSSINDVPNDPFSMFYAGYDSDEDDEDDDSNEYVIPTHELLHRLGVPSHDVPDITTFSSIECFSRCKPVLTRLDSKKDQLTNIVPYLNRAIELDPFHIRYIDHMAFLLHQLGDFEHACFYYRRGGKCNDDKSWVNLASLYHRAFSLYIQSFFSSSSTMSESLRPFTLKNEGDVSLSDEFKNMMKLKQLSIFSVLRYFEFAAGLGDHLRLINHKSRSFRAFLVDFLSIELNHYLYGEIEPLPDRPKYMIKLLDILIHDFSSISALPHASKHRYFLPLPQKLRCYQLKSSILEHLFLDSESAFLVQEQAKLVKQ
mmetsp:Transcript_12297/g.18351  ORF Transcript_12297/g.18351 Transcript_12297/m.18351 type:complete len:2918 (+) Transcript_12297:244-8997(+)